MRERYRMYQRNGGNFYAKDRLGLGEMSREGGGEGKHVGQIPILGVQIPMPVAAPCPILDTSAEETKETNDLGTCSTLNTLNGIRWR
jgi:hypothetical protein